jgi:hypothetical protein
VPALPSELQPGVQPGEVIPQVPSDRPVPQDGRGVPESGAPATDAAPSPQPSAADSLFGQDAAGTGAMPSLSSMASLQSGIGGGPGIPGMLADGFGGGGGTVSIISNVVVVPTAITGLGTTVSGSLTPPGSPVQIVFDVSGGSNTADLFSTGNGRDAFGDGFTNVIGVAEPVPPTDAPTSPGPGFTYDGGQATNVTRIYDGTDLYDIQYSFSRREPMTLILPSPGGPGGGVVVGRLKIAENNSPLPRDRWFVNYSLFDNVPLLQGGVTINRLSPGFEKTFLDKNASFELRMPIATTLDSDIVAGGPTSLGHLEWGDLFMALKFLMLETPRGAFSAGVGMTVPIADDVFVRTTGGKSLVAIRNDAVHLLPYIGWLRQYDGGFFTQGFAQLDLDLNGNPVEANVTGNGLVPIGTVQDMTYLQLDWGVGYLHWVSPGRWGPLIRVVPTCELHYNRSLESADFVQTRGFRIGEAKDDFQLLNTVFGGTLDFRNNSSLSVGYVTPIGNSSDQLFDGELRAFWNRYY